MNLAKKKRTLELHIIKGKSQSSIVSDMKWQMYICEFVHMFIYENKLILWRMLIHMIIDRSDSLPGIVRTSYTEVSTSLKILFGEHIPALIPLHIHLQSY